MNEATQALPTNGTLWRDVAGQPIHAHGGGILKHGSCYYWFGENRLGSTKVSCYRSEDLVHWEFRRHVLTTASRFESIEVRTDRELHPEGSRPRYGEGANIERPKVLYNAKTGKFVMWMHWENGSDYKEARCAVASCDTVDGDYTYHGSFRPAGHMSRDCTLFQDEDGTAYFVSSSRSNADLHVYRLSEDYLAVDELVRILWPGQYREAPAVFKRGDYYFMLSSGCTGWNPNQAKYACASSIAGPWSSLKDIGDATAFDTQPSYVLPVRGSRETAYLYVGDRWDPSDYYASGYVFLPLEFPTDTEVSLRWASTAAIDASAGMVATAAEASGEWRISSPGGGRQYVRASEEGEAVGLRTLAYGERSLNWRITPAAEGCVRIQSCLADGYLQAEGEAATEGPGLGAYEEHERQLWQMVPHRYGWCKIRNRHTGRVLQLCPGEGSGLTLAPQDDSGDPRQDPQAFIVSSVFA